MTRRLVFMLVALAVVMRASIADAGIAFEHYPNERPAEAEVAIPRFLEELEKTGLFAARPETVRGELGIRAPAPGIRDRNLTGQDLLAEINIGLKAQYDLRNDQAIVQFVAAIEKGHANPALLVASVKYREAMLDALVGLATAYHRRNRGDDRLRSLEVMQEVIRSFPDRLASLRQTHGPEPDSLYKAALKTLQTRGTGSLVVSVDDPNALIFVDEGDHPANATFRANLPPGRYRVLIKHPTSNGRRYDVDVLPNETARLSVDWAIAKALVVTERWVGFAGVADETALLYASQLAGQRHGAIVFITIAAYKGAPAMKATLYRVSDAKVVRSYLATLDGPLEAKAAALAIAIAKGETTTNPLLVNAGPMKTDPDDPIPQPNNSDPPPRGTKKWFVAAGIAGAVALAGGGLAFKFALDRGSAADELDRVCAVTCSSQQANALLDEEAAAGRNAIISGVIGGVALAGGVVFILIGRSKKTDPVVAFGPRPGGFVTTYAWRF